MGREPLFPLSRTSITSEPTTNLEPLKFSISYHPSGISHNNGNPTLNHKKDFAIIHAIRDQFKGVQLTNLKNGISKTSLPTIHLEYIEFPIYNPPLSMISGISKIKQLGKALDLSPSPVNEVSTLPPCTLISSLTQRK